MESAKLIAVKEVELDTENDEKAKQVATYHYSVVY